MLPFNVSANHRLFNIFLRHVYHIQMSTLGVMFIYINEPTFMSGDGGDVGCRVANLGNGISALVHLKSLHMPNKLWGEFLWRQKQVSWTNDIFLTITRPFAQSCQKHKVATDLCTANICFADWVADTEQLVWTHYQHSALISNCCWAGQDLWMRWKSS